MTEEWLMFYSHNIIYIAAVLSFVYTYIMVTFFDCPVQVVTLMNVHTSINIKISCYVRHTGISKMCSLGRAKGIYMTVYTALLGVILFTYLCTLLWVFLGVIIFCAPSIRNTFNVVTKMGHAGTVTVMHTCQPPNKESRDYSCKN